LAEKEICQGHRHKLPRRGHRACKQVGRTDPAPAGSGVEMPPGSPPCSPNINSRVGCSMITSFADPFDALFSLQRELEARLASDWLHDLTTHRGPFPPINVFQQGDNILAIMELPGVDKNDLQIQAKANTIRISGKKRVEYTNEVSVHRRERVSGEFDRTLSLPAGRRRAEM
jgi:HSP20 family protein